MIKAIIFDMDGVLIDAKEWHFKAFNEALSIFGYEIKYDDHIENYDGLPTKKKLEILSSKRGFPEKLHEIVNELKQKYTIKMSNDLCFPNFIHELALSKLKSEGYKLVVASNSVRNSVLTLLNKANILKYFDFVLSNEDVSESKPSPEIYKKSFKKLNLKANECLILEDNENGIKAALSSGGFLMKIDTVEDVNYESIKNKINELERIV